MLTFTLNWFRFTGRALLGRTAKGTVRDFLMDAERAGTASGLEQEIFRSSGVEELDGISLSYSA